MGPNTKRFLMLLVLWACDDSVGRHDAGGNTCPPLGSRAADAGDAGAGPHVGVCPEPDSGVPDGGADAPDAEVSATDGGDATVDAMRDAAGSNDASEDAAGLDDADAGAGEDSGRPDVCGDGTTQVVACGTNDNGEQQQACIDGHWQDLDTCKNSFVTVWDTGETSTIKLPLVENGSYDFTVDWGDGSQDVIQAWDAQAKAHTYAAPGTYTVTIEGEFVGWRLATTGDWRGEPVEERKLLEVQRFGPLLLGETTAQFGRASNLRITALDAPGLSKTTSLASAFFDCTSLAEAPSLSRWNVSDITDMSSMFQGASSFNQDLSEWDVASVTNMFQMFVRAESFNQDIGHWDVSNVIDMRSMFQGAHSFNQDIGQWDVSNVGKMSSMFDHARDFNQDISGWNIAKVDSTALMFRGARNFNQDISGWNVASVENMAEMFGGARSFDQDIGGWDVSKVTSMHRMFADAISFNHDIGDWNVSQVTTMHRMFWGASRFDQDIGEWDVSRVADMTAMFADANQFNQDIGAWNVARVSQMGMMFYGASSFDQNIGEWNVSQVKDVWRMFARAGLTSENYDALLLGWSRLALQKGLKFDAGSSTYSEAGASARARLINTFRWEVTDGGPVSDPTAS